MPVLRGACELSQPLLLPITYKVVLGRHLFDIKQIMTISPYIFDICVIHTDTTVLNANEQSMNI